MKWYENCVFCVFVLAGVFAENTSSYNEFAPEAASELEPSVKDSFKNVFLETTSQNSGIINDLSTGGAPIALTLSDVATTELNQKAILSSQTQPLSVNQTKIEDIFKEINQSRTDSLAPQTEKIDAPTKENLTEEIPSFSEWTQKQLEEAEKNKSTHNTTTTTNGKQAKVRWKNYASMDCGAKVVAANPEAVSPSAILSPSRDEYKLNTCNGRIWFIVELCEAIQAKKIDLANFELFSSSPKDFVVSVSDRFPSREWANVGQFVAKDEKDIQSFDLHPHLFGKYIKVEIKSHHGSEHYCPISLFRVYGTSEFEVLEKEESVSHDDDDDDDDTLDNADDVNSKNLLSSATNAVISMVKKAAEVLGNKGNHSNQLLNQTKNVVALVRLCTCPSHLVVCHNCTDALFGQIYELLSCENVKIRDLVNNRLINRVLSTTDVCSRFGFDFKGNLNFGAKNYITAMFPERFLGAMCNMVAIVQNKVVLNNSHINVTTEIENDNIVDNTVVATSEVAIETSDVVITSTSLTDVPLIDPTPTVEIEQSSSDPIVPQETVELVETSETVDNETISDFEESVEGLDDNLEGLMETTSAATPQAQKESVFLRLSNRIKSLERNMSLSGQYLEELSKRYKKQVEEIQKLLEKTIVNMKEEISKKDEANKQLEERLSQLTQTIDALFSERRSWSNTIYCVVVSSLVTIFLVTFCWRVPEPTRKRHEPSELVTIQPKKKRRPSDQALKIVRSSTEHAENLRRKKRKRSVLKRSNSIGTINDGKSEVWVRQDSAPAEVPVVDWVENRVEVPLVLEESEHSTLEPVVLPGAPDFVNTALDSRAKRINGDTGRKTPSLDDSSVLINGGTPKEKRKGLKKIFKKMF